MEHLSQVLTMAWSLPWLWIALGLFVVWAAYWLRQGWLLAHRSGHYSPRLSFLPQLIRFWLSTLIGGWFVGPLRVHGWENVKGLDKARVIIAPNHQREVDGILAARALRLRSMRFLMAINQVQGWRGPLLAWLGAISVGYDAKNPASAAAESATEAMVHEKNAKLLLFPQGKLIKDDCWDRQQFKHGVVRIAKAAIAKLPGEEVYLVPVVCQYEYDPANSTRLQRFAAKLGLPRKFFGRMMYGATVMIGKPIAASTLPDDEDAAIDVYYKAMLETRELCLEQCGQCQH